MIVFKINNIQLLSEYIHLDKEERRVFSSKNHEYLITQVQDSLNNVINNFSAKYRESKKNFERQRHKIDLRFTYPVKEIFWTIQDVEANYNSMVTDVDVSDERLSLINSEIEPHLRIKKVYMITFDEWSQFLTPKMSVKRKLLVEYVKKLNI